MHRVPVIPQARLGAPPSSRQNQSTHTGLQTSLCTVPKKRNVKDVERICRVLGDFKITEDLSQEALEDLAKNIEYRTVARVRECEERKTRLRAKSADEIYTSLTPRTSFATAEP